MDDEVREMFPTATERDFLKAQEKRNAYSAVGRTCTYHVLASTAVASFGNAKEPSKYSPNGPEVVLTINDIVPSGFDPTFPPSRVLGLIIYEIVSTSSCFCAVLHTAGRWKIGFGIDSFTNP